MKVTGTATLNAPPAKVWAALLDPEVLARIIPGCERLERTGADRYRGTVTAGVASIKGTFVGDVELTDLDPPAGLVLRASGAGAPGTVRADVAVRLADLGDGRTELGYDADAVVGGMVGGVGQRVLVGVARRMAQEFFDRLGSELAGGAPAAAEPRPQAGAAAHPEGAAAVSGRPDAFPGRAPAAPAGGAGEFVRGAVFGAVVALAGVAAGVLAGRRRCG
ncbi:SRPBCC family protein [Marinitenerispora sediminis]|uniref:Carbon monoxide dehydrogenase n=1 Tax=Marinitenerispora sediminis TaxID=1931232 RepID=A0A368T213_9ACTN|nr:carbon monoxide dehydrogenase subunit G [Marinitenerispora sediminis]RCV53294.1 carbon monoxide dehydrogenase [Marinitenerispora sediminis]RCV54480.1 carbon monoxide dehydrogenase [Marinitenerispora sediminis]RCV58510.1 carbon monoxide dehydrogenase [Marinitenerispora sediminis]